MGTGLNVLAKNRRDWQFNFIDSGLEVAKTKFQTFLRGKSVLFKWKCQIREFHAHGMERGEFLKRYCGWKKEATLLKQTPKDRTFIHAAHALQWMHERVLKYQKTIPENLANRWNLSRHKFDIIFFLLAHIYSLPAAWAKDLSSEACLRSIAWFGDPHYLSRTSPHSIQCPWDSRIWNFEFRKTLLPLRNLWNFVPCKEVQTHGGLPTCWSLLSSGYWMKKAAHCNTPQHNTAHYSTL